LVQIFNSGFLSSGHSISTCAKTWGSVVIFRSQKGPRAKMFGKHCARDIYLHVRPLKKIVLRWLLSTRMWRHATW